MKLHVLTLAMSASLFLNACSPKSKSSDSPASAAADDSEAINMSEHCTDASAKTCFIEEEQDGRELFYATAESKAALQLLPGIAETNMDFKILTKDEYNAKVFSTVVPRMTYGSNVDMNLEVMTEDGKPVALPGRDDSANGVAGILFKALPKFKNIGGVLKAGKGAGKLKGLLGKKKGGLFGKFFGKRKSGGGFLKDIAINLGLTALFSGLAGGGDQAANARADLRSKSVEVPYGIRLGADAQEEDVTFE